MKESDKYTETDRLVCYKHVDGGTELSMIFDKETKAVDIELSMFHRKDEPALEPMNESTKYSAAFGHWQREITCLGLEDIEFLYKKSKELFELGFKPLRQKG